MATTVTPEQFAALAAATGAKPTEPEAMEPAAPTGPVTVSSEHFAALAAQPSTLESTVRGIAQGVTFGFADELAGALSMATGGSYEQARDESRAAYLRAEKANPKAYIGGEVGGGVLSAFVPGLGWLNAGKTIKAAAGLGAVGGAITGLGKTKMESVEQTAKDVGIAAAIGGGVGGLIGGVFRAVSGSSLDDVGKKVMLDSELDAVASGMPRSPEAMRQLELVLADDSARIWDRTLKKLEGMSQSERVMPNLEDAPKDFINSVLYRPAGEKVGKAVKKRFLDTMSTMNEGGQLARWDAYLTQRKMAESVMEVNEEYARQMAPGLTGAKMEDPLGMGWFKYIQDPMFTGRQVDHTVGSNLEGNMGEFAQAARRVSIEALPFLKRARDLTARSRKSFENLDDIGRAMDDSSGVSKLSQEQQALVGEWRQWFEDVRVNMDQHGVKVGKLQGDYFPMQQAAPDKQYTALRRRFEELQAGPQGYMPGIDEAFDDAILHVSDGIQPRSTKQVAAVLESLLSPEIMKKRLGAEASAAFQRTGVVPDMVREFNVAEAANRYLMGNLKAAHYRSAFENLHGNIAVLRGLGLEDSAKYFEKTFARMSGEPSNFYAYTQYLSSKWKAHWDKVLDDDQMGALKTMGAKLARGAPDILSWATTQAYPNLLGWNLYAPIRNMSQTWVMTAPEMGGKFGLDMTAKGWMRAAQALREGVKPGQFLKERGLLGDIIEGEAVERAIIEGLEAVPGLAKAAGGVEKLGQWGMKFYTASETANRYITYHIGQEVAKDLLSGSASEGVRKFVGALPAGVKAEIGAAVRAGDDAAVGDLMGQYLMRKTMFDYGKAGLSQFGQDFGRLASMFMKWPTVILSDIAELARHEKGWRRAIAPFRKYGTPLVLLGLGQQAMEELDAQKHPLAQLILGNSLISWAPVSAVWGLERPPPLVGVGVQTLGATKDLVDGELKQAYNKITKAFEPFIPGVGMVSVTKRRLEKAFGED